MAFAHRTGRENPEVGTAMETQFARDVALCDALDEASWKNQPFWRKALAWLAYRVRRFL